MPQDPRTRNAGPTRASVAEAPRRAADETFRLGDWHVRPAEGLLESGDVERYLAPQQMAILELLADRQGRVVSKDEIFDEVWRGAVVEEGALPRCISEIRSALGDDARDPRYIRTVPKKGYRLIAPVEVVPAAESMPPATAAPAVIMPAEAEPAARRWHWWLAAVTLGALLAVGAARVRDRLAPATADDPRRTIAVLGIADLSGRPEAGWLATALAEMLTTELAVSSRLRTIPEDTVAQMKGQLSMAGVPDAETLRRLRGHLGVDLGVVGNFWVTPAVDDPATRTLRLDLKVLTGEPPEIVAAAAVTGSAEELDELVLEAGQRLRETLGLGGRPANENRLAGEPGPVDPTAARFYYQGLQALRRLDARAAVDLLQRSRDADPANPYVRSALARAWSALGHDARARDAADGALETVANLPREQRLWAEARAYAVKAEWAEAIDRLQALWLVTGDNLEYGHELARAQLDAGRPRDAQSTLAELGRRAGEAPQDPRIASALDDLRARAEELSLGWLVRRAHAVSISRSRG